jgi:hypothetical protein
MMPTKMNWFFVLLLTFPLSVLAQGGGNLKGTSVPNSSTNSGGQETLKLGVPGDSVIRIMPREGREYTGEPTRYAIDESGKPIPNVSREKESKYGIFAGLGAMAKASVNTNVSNGTKTDVAFATVPDYHLSLFVPFSKKGSIGIGLDVGYSYYSYITKPESNPTNANSIKYQYSYFNLFPHLNLAGFIIGASFLSSPDLTSKNLDGKETVDATFYKATNEPVGVTEIRIGGSIPVLDEDFGRLNVNILAGYMIDGQHKDKIGDMNPQPASLSLGLTYLFKIPF